MSDKDNGESAGLDVVFKKLKVDKSWDGIARPNDALPETTSSCIFKGKITKRSPVKSRNGEVRSHHNKRTKPYERDDLPFGDDGLECLTFRSEECKNSKCTCNRKHRTQAKSGDDLLNFAIACKSPQSSPERKIIKDSKFKLHHKVKDHKVVLRAARLKLHRLNWYKGPVLKRGTLNKQTTFGNDAMKSDFSTVAKAPQIWKSKFSVEQPQSFTGLSFTQQQLAKTGVRSRYTQPGSEAKSLTVQNHCSCASQNRVSNQNTPKSTTLSTPSNSVIGKVCKCKIESSSSGNYGTFSSGAESSSRMNRKRPSSPHASRCPLHPTGQCVRPCSCAEQARVDSSSASSYLDYSVDELASYLDEYVHIPKKMSEMAEMMYT